MKKIISVLLTLVFVFTMCMPAFAVGEKDTAYNGDPIVVVRGIDFTGLVREDDSKAISFGIQDIFSLLTDFGIRKLKGDKDAFANALISFAVDLFDPVASDKDGNPKHSDVHIPTFMSSADKIDLSGDEWADTAVGLFRSVAQKFGGKSTYLFTFDWRKSPTKLAADLNAFIEMVKTETGKSKVDIAACSMGGMITTAYMEYYGTESIDSVTYLSSAHNGGNIIGSAFTGDLVVNADALGDFLIEKTSGNFMLNLLLIVLDGVGVVRFVTEQLNNFISKYKDKLYDEFLRVSLGTAFGLWALCPDEYFDEAVDFFYGDCESEYTAALSELEKVREFVFKTDDIIAKAYADGLKVSFVSHYDSRQLPIYSGYEAHGDGVLESNRTSGYGTFAKYGQTLSDAQIAGVDPQYISPDRVVNASTCLYKNTTWIVKGAKHVGCKDGSDHTEFAIWLITRDTQPTVATNSEYPRFINVDSNENFIAF